MALGDFTRINTNVSALNALNALQKVGNKMGIHQARLATGMRLNSAADDPAGYAIGKKLEARSRTLSASLNNIGDVKSMLGIAEGGLLNINDILVTMKEKVLQAASDTLGSAERYAITLQIGQLNSEIDDIVQETKFNDVALIDGSYTGKSFQTGASETDNFMVSISSAHDSGASGLNTASVDVTSAANATAALSTVGSAIDTVSESLENIGSWVNRLTVKENTVSVAISNTEAAYSRIFDADMAKEQLESSKLQILQQTATAMLAQANMSSSSVLALFQ
ncbi:flagellin [candidate division KSB1 bacterium]|nr:flagellin [candidate division KSB1 bacterium]